MTKHTPLYERHQRLGAKLVDFAGWEMPLHYGSQLEEHHKVRQNAGMFDVSHLKGEKVKAFLRYLLANDVEKLQQPGKALYTCMLNERGGVIDDLIVYYLEPHYYRIVINAGTREKDLVWLRHQAKAFAVCVTERSDLAIIAVQGPLAREKVQAVLAREEPQLTTEMKPFYCVAHAEWLIARTGYTGEDGVEITLPADKAPIFWQQLLEQGISPCGLGARDTLRLEAGLNLYGHDMDETITPLEANLGWTVAFEPFDRQFIGRAALEQQKAQGLQHKLIGLILEGKGVLRENQTVQIEGVGNGKITSGSFSPTLGHSIALARVPSQTGTRCLVQIRDKYLPARVVKPPFVRAGKKVFTTEE
jgi:aminomethyltransferase